MLFQTNPEPILSAYATRLVLIVSRTSSRNSFDAKKLDVLMKFNGMRNFERQYEVVADQAPNEIVKL